MQLNIINIYGRPNCQWCMSATTLLDIKGWHYTYHDMTRMEPYNAQKILNDSGMRSVPIVKVGDIYIGGFDQLKAYVHGKELENGLL